MVLGKLPVPGHPTIWTIVGQGPIALAVGAGGGCLDIFTLIYPFSPLSPSLWETARYRLKYCLKGPLNPKQPTNEYSIFSTYNFVCFVRVCIIKLLAKCDDLDQATPELLPSLLFSDNGISRSHFSNETNSQTNSRLA